MVYTFYPKGVCSNRCDITLRDGVIEDVQIQGGCDGNLKGIVQLLKGQQAREAAERMRGICCGKKKTSCPDQIAIALLEAVEKEGECGDA